MEIDEDHLSEFYTISRHISFDVRIMGLFSDLLIGKDKKKQRCIGLLLMFIAGVFLVLGNSLFQFIEMDSPANSRVSADQMLIIRCGIQLLFSLVFMVNGKVHFYGGYKKNLLPLLCMGVMEVCVIIFMYEAIQRMPVGDATVLQFTAPVFTSFLGFVILKTRLRIFDTIFGIISFVGVLFIAKPNLLFPVAKMSVVQIMASKNHTYHGPPKTIVYSLHYMEGAMFALGAALSLSLFFILNKMNGMKIDVILTIFYPSIMGVFVGPILMMIRQERFLLTEVSGRDWGIMVVIGFLSFIGLMLLGESLQLQDPGPAIMIRNCDIIVVYILQYLLMHILPSPSVAVGTSLIIGCTCLIVLNHSFNLDNKCFGDHCYQDDILDEDEDEAKFMLLNNQEELLDEENNEIVTN